MLFQGERESLQGGKISVKNVDVKECSKICTAVTIETFTNLAIRKKELLKRFHKMFQHFHFFFNANRISITMQMKPVPFQWSFFSDFSYIFHESSIRIRRDCNVFDKSSGTCEGLNGYAVFTRPDVTPHRRKTARIFDAFLIFLSPVKHGRWRNLACVHTRGAVVFCSL